MKILKSAVALLLAMALLSGLTVAAAESVSGGYPTLAVWAEEEVLDLYGKGAVPEALMSSFDSPITRAEFTAVIVSAYEKITGAAAPIAMPGFTDITASAYITYIAKAYTLGIVSGRTAQRFDPDATITRQEAAKILYTLSQALGGAGTLETFDLAYPDADDIDAWALPYVCYGYSKGLMEGTDKGFEPKSTLTRQQAMVIIQRLWQTSGWSGNSQTGSETDPAVYRALAVGIYDYEGTENDGDRFKLGAQEFTEQLRHVTVKDGAYEVSSAFNLLKDDFFACIAGAFAQADDNDVSVFLLSSHGAGGGERFGNMTFSEDKFVLSDGSVNQFVDFGEIVTAMQQIKGTKVLIIGSCYSGGMTQLAADDDSMLIVTACAADEQSFGLITNTESYNVFERAVDTALGGSGSLVDLNGDGATTFSELAEYVKYLVLEAPDGASSSVQIKQGRDVVLALGLTQ